MIRVVRSLSGVLALAAAAVLALWWAGPPGLETGPYVQDVTGHSALVARIDRAPSRVALTLESDAGAPIRVAGSETRDHALRVEGLRPGTQYRYHFDDAPDRGGSFRTPPDDDRTPVRFASVGDSGALPWWFNVHELGMARVRPLFAWILPPAQWQVARWIAEREPDFFVHLGDIAYWPRDLREAHEEAFFRPFAPVLEQSALYAVLGNHDLPRDGGVPPFDRLFHLPAGDPAAPARSYTFAWGALRVFGIDNETLGWKPGSAEYRWLDGALGAASEPWLVVAMHKPRFTSCRQGAEPERAHPWSLFERHGVDLVLSGDDHLYQRFVAPGAPVQLVVGGGGKSLYDCTRDHPHLVASALEWSAVVVDVRGATLTTRAVGAGGSTLDSHHIDRRTGPLPAGIGDARRARILALRRTTVPGEASPAP